MATIFDRIEELRGGMAWRVFADESKVPVSTLKNFRDRPQQSSRALPKLAKRWNVNLLWLQTGEGPKETDGGRNASPGRQIAQPLDLPINKNVEQDSRVLRPDAVILQLADRWLAHQEGAMGAPLKGLRRWEELADLYARIAADGGVMSPEHERELIAKAMATVLEKQGETADERHTKTSGHGRRSK
ncbi:hypothetical protein [Luteimonas cucumeris]|nr:hypothetical protein [Luteimonas cucumeris]